MSSFEPQWPLCLAVMSSFECREKCHGEKNRQRLSWVPSQSHPRSTVVISRAKILEWSGCVPQAQIAPSFEVPNQFRNQKMKEHFGMKCILWAFESHVRTFLTEFRLELTYKFPKKPTLGLSLRFGELDIIGLVPSLTWFLDLQTMLENLLDEFREVQVFPPIPVLS